MAVLLYTLTALPVDTRYDGDGLSAGGDHASLSKTLVALQGALPLIYLLALSERTEVIARCMQSEIAPVS